MKRILLPLLLLFTLSASGQQSAYYTQYLFNGLVINPAYAGSKGVLNVNALHRSQWAGLEGGPSTQTLSVDGSIRKQKIGWGVQLINDQVGIEGQRSLLGSAAVRIKMGRKARLAVGLSAGLTQYYLDANKIHVLDPEMDRSIPLTRQNTILPDAKAGLFFHSDRYFLGISATNLIPSGNEFVLTQSQHYFLTSGYVFILTDGLKFKPSFLVKEDFKSPTNIDFNAFFLFGDRLWLGGTYRKAFNVFNNQEVGELELSKDNAWAAMAEVYVTPKVKIGYSYDMPLSSLKGYSSHEVSLGLYFYKKRDTPSLTIRHF